jgi:hypothetical protein
MPQHQLFATLAFAREVDTQLAIWIEANVSVPNTMTDADRSHINAIIGMQNT